MVQASRTCGFGEDSGPSGFTVSGAMWQPSGRNRAPTWRAVRGAPNELLLAGTFADALPHPANTSTATTPAIAALIPRQYVVHSCPTLARGSLACRTTTTSE